MHFYGPKGVSGVIALWDFPLEINLCIDTAAIVGFNMVDIFKEAGLPAGVFNYVSVYGREIGDHLVDHKDVSLIAFTGSMDIDLRIYERAARTAKVHPGQMHIKKVICEMDGKDATI